MLRLMHVGTVGNVGMEAKVDGGTVGQIVGGHWDGWTVLYSNVGVSEDGVRATNCSQMQRSGKDSNLVLVSLWLALSRAWSIRARTSPLQRCARESTLRKFAR